jgi:hypothetical protein
VPQITVIKFSPDHREAWNKYVLQSKNGTFLFDRGYMEYHDDRFEDCSLLFIDERNRLVGLMPASRHGDTVISHGGLTYGGMISNEDMKTATMLQIFDVMLCHLSVEGYAKLLYKPVPHIFHRIPAEEDLYALFVNNARLYRRDASSVIYLPERMKLAKGKREGVKKAQRNGLSVRESRDFKAFFAIGMDVMRERHKLVPVHTSEEMELLGKRFPHNIRLHGTFSGERMLAGALTYVFEPSVHVQYMYNSNDGLEQGALDVVLDHLINEVYTGLRYFSFGVSTEDNGRYLNEGLIHQKEMFGARSVVHDFYEIDLA